jgi:hypothetical protein
LGVLVFTRSDVETMLLRAPGALFQKLNDGRIENLYTVKVINKTAREMPIEFKLENLRGEISLMGNPDFKVSKDNLAEASLLIALEPAVLQGPSTKLSIGVYSGGKKIETVSTSFIGPRPEAAPVR